jgi:uncharacterized protein YjaG (DUF416 family)
MMSIIRFSSAHLTRELDRLLPQLRVIFAATCAERLVPAYSTFSDLARQGEPETVTRSLARLWEDIAGEPMSGDELQGHIDACMALIPPDDDMTLAVETAYAEDAVTAVVYALTCRQNGNSQEAMWSAQCACEAADYFATSREAFVPKPVSNPSRVFEHPLIQAELARQLRDITELLRIVDEDVRQVASRFRDRAKAESKIFFGVPS